MCDNNDNNVFIELTVSDQCNCNCSYCFEGHKSCKLLSLQEEDKYIKLLVDYCKLFDVDKHKWLSISFWGGEPFMNVEFMNKIVENTCIYPFVRYHCYSNGVLVDKYRYFMQQPFFDNIKDQLHVQLSYDGDPHNVLKRGYSKDKILETADLLQEAGVYFAFKATLSFDMVKHLPEIWKSYEELFYKYPDANVRYIPTMDTTASINVEQYFEDWKKALREVAKLEYKFIKKHNFPLWSWFGDHGIKMTCKLKNTCMIHSDGNIYVCHGAPYSTNKNTIIGTIDDSLKDVIDKSKETNGLLLSCLKCNSTYCAVCHILTLDDNDSVFDNWILKRNIDKVRCMFYKEFGYVSRLLKFAVFSS